MRIIEVAQDIMAQNCDTFYSWNAQNDRLMRIFVMVMETVHYMDREEMEVFWCENETELRAEFEEMRQEVQEMEDEEFGSLEEEQW